MKKQIERIKSEIRNYINNCKERKNRSLNKENWIGLTNLINAFVHKIDNDNTIEGHYRRDTIKKELIEYSINYFNPKREIHIKNIEGQYEESIIKKIKEDMIE